MHQYLYKENMPAQNVYLVRSGEFLVTKQIRRPASNGESIEDIYAAPMKATKTQNVLFKKNTAEIVESLELTVISVGQFIGEEDMAYN
jgi:CRP-like cAMP-binding protein